MEIKKEIEWGGHTLSLSTGKFANQAAGAVFVRYGDTSVLCTVVASKNPTEGIDFFPLTVNYQEKAFAGGKIPGGFYKREGKPSERETLTSRLIDRPLRPLFHENFKNETQIVCTVLSFDNKCDSDIAALIGASAAIRVAGLPFSHTVAAARIGMENGKFILNPPFELINDDDDDQLDLLVAGTKEGLLMVESEAKELSETQMLSALKFAHDSYQPVIDLIDLLVAETGKPKWEIPTKNISEPEEFLNKFFNSKDIQNKLAKAYKEKAKLKRYENLDTLQAECVTEITAARDDIPESQIKKAFFDARSEYVRKMILNSKNRIDGRALDEIRPISSEISVLPKVHGSALFMRGETQALGICTLGTVDDEQFVDSLIGDYKERFALHYNFPPYSVNEIGRMGAPGRREIGHGKLAWKAVKNMLPSRADFPYAIRVVSEILACNGSSSMATVCAASLSLMDAGVPLKTPVAGIAMGLVQDEKNDVILSDIMAEEDHLGDMDFKVAGTANGITALQMDIKIPRVTFSIIESTLSQANNGLQYILSEMSKSISSNKTEVNENAPRIKIIKISKDKIRDLIGPGGKVIKGIIEKVKVKIDISDEGIVTVSAGNLDSLGEALECINNIVGDPEVGAIYHGIVVKITDFGAFVNFMGRDGLVHISELANKRVEKVTDVLQEGQQVRVKFLGLDRGKSKLSIKAIGDGE